MTTRPRAHAPRLNTPPGSPTQLDVTILLPCRNEATTIAVCTTLALAWIARRNLTSEVLVVDNGSTDTSADRAHIAGARVITEPRIGYGHALAPGSDPPPAGS